MQPIATLQQLNKMSEMAMQTIEHLHFFEDVRVPQVHGQAENAHEVVLTHLLRSARNPAQKAVVLLADRCVEADQVDVVVAAECPTATVCMRQHGSVMNVLRCMILPVESVNQKQGVLEPPRVAVAAVLFERAGEVVNNDLRGLLKERLQHRKRVVATFAPH
jgi:hypothetical protein